MHETSSHRSAATRIRVGILLVLLSWVPFAQAVIWITSPSDQKADRIRLAIWGVQILVGFVGVFLAGKETIAMAKRLGWRKAPGEVWRLLRSPDRAG
jgi:hypothetical protein